MRIGRLFRRALALVIVVYLAWLGYRALSFRRYGGPYGARAGVAAAEAAGERTWELEGVYHVHSRFSDGRRDVEGIAAEAAAIGLDFLILTDHGHPNLASLRAQGRRNGLFVLAGSEISTSRGHLVALGFDPPERPFDQDALLAEAEIAKQGGFSVIAHPYSKTNWSWGGDEGAAGLEILNGDTEMKRNIAAGLLRLPLLLLRPEAAVLAILGPQNREFDKWERLCRARPTYAFYAVDAHFAYGAALRLFHIHVLLDAPPPADFAAARARIFNALRGGRFYNTVEAAAEADGFRFSARSAGLAVSMGGSVPGGRSGASVRFEVRAPFDFAHEIRLLRDGRTITRSRKNVLVFEAVEPGAYRAEVSLLAPTPLDPRIPWIASNPIFVAKEKP